MDAAPRFVVRFHQLMQNSQELGSNDEHMISQVSFSLEVVGKAKGEFSATLKQTVGSEFNDANIEVSSGFSIGCSVLSQSGRWVERG